MDNERTRGETSTIRTNDRGEVSGKPAGAAESGKAHSEPPIDQQEAAIEENEDT